MKKALIAVALAFGLAGCTQQDNAKAHEEAERAKQDLKKGAQQTAQGLRKAGDAVNRGADQLKRKVDKELNTPDTSRDQAR